MVKQVLKKIINSSLEPLGLRLCRTDNHTVSPWTIDYLVQKYRTLITEIDGCFSEYLFPELLPCPGRVDLMTRLLGTPISEAFYIIAHLQKSVKLEGDVCEFGVAQGATSALLANEIRSTDKTLWLFDSFKGLGKPSEKDLLVDDIFNLGSIDKYQGTMACGVDEVKSRLKAISFPSSRVKIIAGFIEDTIKDSNLPARVCFAYVDLDFYRPISVALRFLNERVVGGGFIVVDDYGFFSSGAKTAVDEFLEEYGHQYVTIRTSNFANQSTPFLVLGRRM